MNNAELYFFLVIIMRFLVLGSFFLFYFLGFFFSIVGVCLSYLIYFLVWFAW